MLPAGLRVHTDMLSISCPAVLFRNGLARLAGMFVRGSAFAEVRLAPGSDFDCSHVKPSQQALSHITGFERQIQGNPRSKRCS
eukprot:5490466-Karenia_brevis.AAC.1